jgi:hypothetical protein
MNNQTKNVPTYAEYMAAEAAWHQSVWGGVNAEAAAMRASARYSLAVKTATWRDAVFAADPL